MMTGKTIRSFLVSLFFVFSLQARDIILEFKGAYFKPTDSEFKNIYGKGGALYGPELTVQVCEDTPWYAFAGFNYFHKKGHSIGLCDETTVKLIPLALGVKYLERMCDDRVDFYVGLGFQPVNVRTKNCSDFVFANQSKWGFGGIAKVGANYRMDCNFLIDLFVDYSFVKVGSNDCDCLMGLQSVKANVSGAIFGAGLGYSF
ncbi:MAG: hypothetical protein NTX86_02735 [Candidatus Dependentiae bacterium]|nr:hypothetical protein [Candidatus Dependentiae bacterium]